MSGITLVSNRGFTLEGQTGQDAPLNIRGMTVSYGQMPAVYSIDLKVKSGSIFGILGPNGAGKSTLLKAALAADPVRSMANCRSSQPNPRAIKNASPSPGKVAWEIASLINAFLLKYRNVPAIPAAAPSRLDPSVTRVALYPRDKESADHSI